MKQEKIVSKQLMPGHQPALLLPRPRPLELNKEADNSRDRYRGHRSSPWKDFFLNFANSFWWLPWLRLSNSWQTYYLKMVSKMALYFPEGSGTSYMWISIIYEYYGSPINMNILLNSGCHSCMYHGCPSYLMYCSHKSWSHLWTSFLMEPMKYFGRRNK